MERNVMGQNQGGGLPSGSSGIPPMDNKQLIQQMIGATGQVQQGQVNMGNQMTPEQQKRLQMQKQMEMQQALNASMGGPSSKAQSSQIGGQPQQSISPTAQSQQGVSSMGQQGAPPMQPRPQQTAGQGQTPMQPRPGGATPRPNGVGKPQPTNMQQGSGYNPNGRQPQQRNTGGGRPPQGQGQGPGGMNKTTMIMVIAGVFLVIILAGAYFMFSGSKEDGVEEETVEYTEETLDWGTEETLVWDFVEETTPAFEYTQEEVKALRAAGYTGDEIEFYLSQERPAQDLLDEADAEQKAYVEKFIAPYYDDTSDEYRRNLRNTWLGLEERDDVADFADTGFTYSDTKNLDFEKVPVYGDQIFLKVYLDDDSHDKYFFMPCMPDRYMELGNSGNIVVNYNYIYPSYVDEEGVLQEDTSRMFITSAQEVLVGE